LFHSPECPWINKEKAATCIGACDCGQKHKQNPNIW
jgi:hypothetical protein